MEATVKQIVYWTKAEYKQAIDEHYKDMKEHKFTKADCKRDVDNVMRDNNIQIKK